MRGVRSDKSHISIHNCSKCNCDRYNGFCFSFTINPWSTLSNGTLIRPLKRHALQVQSTSPLTSKTVELWKKNDGQIETSLNRSLYANFKIELNLLPFQDGNAKKVATHSKVDKSDEYSLLSRFCENTTAGKFTLPLTVFISYVFPSV